VGYIGRNCLKKVQIARCWWLTPVLLPTQEAEIRRITVRSQPGQIVQEALSQKKKKERKKKRKKSQKRAGGAAQGTDTKFKPQYFKKKKGMNNQKLSLRVVVQIQPTIWSRKS
jgi:hypothetical protein